MSDDQLPDLETNADERLDPGTNADADLDRSATTGIERVIEQIGAQYIEDLRMLSQEFGRLYETQLSARDQQIAALRERLLATEHERDTLAGQIHELKRMSAKYLADLQALGAELDEALEPAGHEPEVAAVTQD